MKTVACRIDLGMTRVAGYILYDPASMEFQETTPREVERLVRKGQVNGLTFGNTEDSQLVPDFEKWKLNNLKIKSGVGNYRNWNSNDARGDTIYSVVRAVSIKGITGSDGKELKCIYETINNRCARVFYTKKQLLGIAQFNWVGGIDVDPSTETIHLCTGVAVEDWSDREVFELGTSVVSKDKLQDMTMEELFGSVGGVMSEGELPEGGLVVAPGEETFMEGAAAEVAGEAGTSEVVDEAGAGEATSDEEAAGEGTATPNDDKATEESSEAEVVEASGEGTATEIAQETESGQEEHQESPVENTSANDEEHQEVPDGTQITGEPTGESVEHQEENSEESSEAPASEESPVEFTGEQHEGPADAEQTEQTEGEPSEEEQEGSEEGISPESNHSNKAAKNRSHKKRSR